MKMVGVIGLGQMGRVIAWAMQNLGHSLVLVDSDKKARSLCKGLLDEHRPDNGHIFADDKEASTGMLSRHLRITILLEPTSR